MFDALSERLHLEIKREDHVWTQDYERGVPTADLRLEMQRTMQNHCGVFRFKDKLEEGVQKILEIEKQVLAPQIKVSVNYATAAQYGVPTPQVLAALQAYKDARQRNLAINLAAIDLVGSGDSQQFEQRWQQIDAAHHRRWRPGRWWPSSTRRGRP